MRLVDADEIIKKANFQPLAPYILKRDVDNAPTIDAEPVVRCNDCKLYGSWTSCPYGALNGDYPPNDWYCADGERRKDNEAD